MFIGERQRSDLPDERTCLSDVGTRGPARAAGADCDRRRHASVRQGAQVSRGSSDRSAGSMVSYPTPKMREVDADDPTSRPPARAGSGRMRMASKTSVVAYSRRLKPTPTTAETTPRIARSAARPARGCMPGTRKPGYPRWRCARMLWRLRPQAPRARMSARRNHAGSPRKRTASLRWVR